MRVGSPESGTEGLPPPAIERPSFRRGSMGVENLCEIVWNGRIVRT